MNSGKILIVDDEEQVRRLLLDILQDFDSHAVDTVDKALKLRNKDHISSHKWKPSKFGYCFRNQYWSRKGEVESNPSDSRQIRVMFSGQLFHNFVQGLLGDVEIEVKIECEDVKGFTDIVRGNEVVDIKSQHSKSF